MSVSHRSSLDSHRACCYICSRTVDRTGCSKAAQVFAWYLNTTSTGQLSCAHFLMSRDYFAAAGMNCAMSSESHAACRIWQSHCTGRVCTFLTLSYAVTLCPVLNQWKLMTSWKLFFIFHSRAILYNLAQQLLTVCSLRKFTAHSNVPRSSLDSFMGEYLRYL